MKEKGVSLDYAFFVSTIKEYPDNPKEIYKTYSHLYKDYFDAGDMFEEMKYNILTFQRVPSIEELSVKFSIDFKDIKPDMPSGYYLKAIKERYLKRNIKNFATHIESANLSDIDVNDLYKPVLRMSEEYRRIINLESSYVKSISEVGDEAIAIIDNALSGKNINYIPAPWATFQEHTGGILPGEVMIIAGRPGTGKTWMLYKWAYFLATMGRRVILFNTEMSATATMLRLACLESGVHVSDIRSKTISADKAEVVKRKIKDISQMDNFIITDVGFTPTMSNVIDSIKQYRPEIAFIDSAYLIKADMLMGSRTENASEVADSLKSVAISIGIPIVYAIQHNREAVKGAPSLATLSLSDSNAWNASFVLSIDPPKDFGDDMSVTKNTWKVHMIKNREGTLCTFYVSKETYEETEYQEINVSNVTLRI